MAAERGAKLTGQTLKTTRGHGFQATAGQYNMAEGPIKTFTLLGIKDSPPYHHDGRLRALDDTVEFFNPVLGLKLADDEKQAVVAFMRCL
jgi:cytochrome c peroxidase